MKVIGKFVVSDLKERENGQRITLVDLSEGGQMTVSSSDVKMDVKIGAIVQADLVLKAGLGKFGPYMQVVAGSMQKI